MTDAVILTCPSCGVSLPFEAQSLWLLCEHCRVDYVVKQSGSMIVLAPIEEELNRIQKGAARQAALNILKKLNLEILDLQAELDELANEGTPLETVRLIGFCGIILGIVFAVLFGFSNSNAFSLAAVGIVLGIVLHGSTELIGKDYYLRKAFLKGLIYKKQVEVFQHETFLSQ